MFIVLAGLTGHDAFAAPGSGSSTLYSCVDDHGRTITSDRPIDACAQREMRQLNPDGSVRGVIQAPLTPAQQKQAAEAARQREEAERARRAQKARDRSLLLKFDDLPALEARRQHDLRAIDEEIRVARERIRYLGEELAEAQKEVDDWKAEHKRPVAPVKLTQRVTELSNSILAEDARARDRLNERGAVNERYDQDAVRLRELLGLDNTPAAR